MSNVVVLCLPPLSSKMPSKPKDLVPKSGTQGSPASRPISTHDGQDVAVRPQALHVASNLGMIITFRVSISCFAFGVAFACRSFFVALAQPSWYPRVSQHIELVALLPHWAGFGLKWGGCPCPLKNDACAHDVVSHVPSIFLLWFRQLVLVGRSWYYVLVYRLWSLETRCQLDTPILPDHHVIDNVPHCCSC